MATAQLLALVALLLALTPQALASRGPATVYDAPSQPACPAEDLTAKQASYFKQFFAAVDSSVFDGSQCGQCLAVTGPNGRTVVVKVVDECTDCTSGGLALSPKALQRLTGSKATDAVLSWGSVNCATMGAKKAPLRPRIQVRSRKLELRASKTTQQ